MYQWLQAHQLNIMLGFSSVCFMVGFFVLLTKSMPAKRKASLAYLEFSAAILLFSDRLAYVYQGEIGYTPYHMVRLSNFLVFFLTISEIHGFNNYLKDLCRNEVGLKKRIFRLQIVDLICLIGWILVIVTQFTGLYYTFDRNNVYQRGPGFMICYAIPFLALIIDLSVIFQYMKKLSRNISIPLILFTIIPMMASLLQAKYYGLSLTNIAIVGMDIVLYLFAILEMNEKLEMAQQRQLDEAQNKSLSLRRSFEQTVKALVNAADERDRYTRGHSLRVAEYSAQIAKELGMDEKECFRVYFSAALHDIGKMRLSDELISKRGRLSGAEEKQMKNVPVYGKEILSGIDEVPYLGIAAAGFCERYDGKGYPAGLKEDEIPLAARIVAVANAYDEMTSFREGRKPMVQGKVREKLTEASGKEYDPKIVDIMVSMIDKDTEYMMREPEDVSVAEEERNDLTVVKQMHFEAYKARVSEGVRIAGGCIKLTFDTKADEGYERDKALPSIILFDSFDSCVHRNERTIRNLHYMEFGEIWMDGNTIATSARDIKKEIRKKEGAPAASNGWDHYTIEAVGYRDHVKIRIDSPYQTTDAIVALADATRFVYLGLTGEHCIVKNIALSEEAMEVNETTIPRIAPEVDYFTRKDGDIPNVEVDSYRETSSKGISVEEGLRLLFSTQTLPEASLVQHCAHILLYSSDDGVVKGKNYKEYACIRLDGDDATEVNAQNALTVQKSEDFGGWDAWKEANRRGIDVEVSFRRRRNRITFETENAGILIKCTTTVPEGTETVYAALTGNLCTLMNIRIRFEG